MTTATLTTGRRAQRVRALDRANAIRLGRAQLRRQIMAGQTTIADVMRDVPDAANGWSIGHLLTAQRRWGPRRARSFLNVVDHAPIGELRPVGSLTERQRLLIAAALS